MDHSRLRERIREVKRAAPLDDLDVDSSSQRHCERDTSDRPPRRVHAYRRGRGAAPGRRSAPARTPSASERLGVGRPSDLNVADDSMLVLVAATSRPPRSWRSRTASARPRARSSRRPRSHPVRRSPERPVSGPSPCRRALSHDSGSRIDRGTRAAYLCA